MSILRNGHVVVSNLRVKGYNICYTYMYVHTYVYIHTYTCPSQSEKSHGCVSSTVRVNGDMPPPWSRWSWAKYVYFARETQEDSNGRSYVFIFLFFKFFIQIVTRHT